MNLETQHRVVQQFLKCETLTYEQLSRAVSVYTISNSLLGDANLKPLIGMKTSKFHDENGQIHDLYYSGECIQIKIEKGGFRSNDVFRLTTEGQNILYRLKKEQRQEQLQIDAIRWAKYATLGTVISIIVAIAIYVLSSR